MMIHAFSELYLYDAQMMLANMFDYAITDCNISPSVFSAIFLRSRVCEQIEICNPAYISGKSGTEVAMQIIKEQIPDFDCPSPLFRQERTPAYWAGWALAYYYWYTSKSFSKIFSRIPLDDILSMYGVFHEMDILGFVESMERRYYSVTTETNLRILRSASGLSQSELAKKAGVSIRCIQLYEQRENDIDRAAALTVYKIAKALGCRVEDILEIQEPKQSLSAL